MATVVVLDNIRSVHNVGSILRTCDGFGVKTIYACGITPHPLQPNDQRLPHVTEKLEREFHKTALGAEKTVSVIYETSVIKTLEKLSSSGFRVIAIEQNERSIDVSNITTTDKVALVLGNEVSGISLDVLRYCDDVAEITMTGSKESFNVSVAAGIALYALAEGSKKTLS
jgi:23S rRNA (guanosine2251-2'-O)-methyltransferase